MGVYKSMNVIKRGKGAIWKMVVKGSESERETKRNTITFITPENPTPQTLREMRKMGLI